jgi:hypothetical protein
VDGSDDGKEIIRGMDRVNRLDIGLPTTAAEWRKEAAPTVVDCVPNEYWMDGGEVKGYGPHWGKGISQLVGGY